MACTRLFHNLHWRQAHAVPPLRRLFFRSVLLLDHVFGVDKVAHGARARAREVGFAPHAHALMPVSSAVCYATPREMEEAGSESVHLHLDIYRPKWVRGALTRGARAQQEPSGDGSLASTY